MADRNIKTSRLVERLERRMSRRPQIGLTPTFYARFGLADPWLSAPANGDPSQIDDGFTFVSARPFYAMMRRLAQARWRRERRVSRFFERRAGVLTATRQRRFPGEMAAPIAALMPASSGFMPPGPPQTAAWRGLPDLGGMALPQAWTPPTEAPAAASPAFGRRASGSRARVSPVAWLSHKARDTESVRAPRAERQTERIVEVEREESESFAARPSRETAGSAPALRGRSPGTREYLTVEPENTGRTPARPAVARDLPATNTRRAAAAAPAQEELAPSFAPRPAAPAQWAGLRLAHAAAAADPVARAVDERSSRLPVAARRVIDQVIVATEGLEPEARAVEIRRVIRRRLGAREIREVYEVLEEIVPGSADRPARFAAARSLPAAAKSSGLRPVLSSSPTMQTVAPIPEPSAAAPAARPRRDKRPAPASWASSRSIGSASSLRATAPVGRQVEAARAAATPASLSRSPVSRPATARSASFRTPRRDTALSAAHRTPGGDYSVSGAFRTPAGQTARSEALRTASGETLRSEGFRTPGSETAQSRAFRTASGETLLSEAHRTPSAETARSEAHRTAAGETARSEAHRTAAGETARSEAHRTPASETARSEAFRTPATTRPSASVEAVDAPYYDEQYEEEALFSPVERRAERIASSPTARAVARLSQGIEEAPEPTVEPEVLPKLGGTSWAAERLSSTGTQSPRSGSSTSILPRVAPSATDSAVVLTVSTPEEAERLAGEVRRRNPKAQVKVISGASAWRSPSEPGEARAPKGLTLAAMRDIAPSVGYTASSVLRDGASQRQNPTDVRTTGPASYARVAAPTATVLSAPSEPTAASPGFRTPRGARGASAGFRTPRSETSSSVGFRTGSSAWSGSQTFRTPEGRYVASSLHRTPQGARGASAGFRTPRGAWTGASVFRTPAGEQLSRSLPSVYQPAQSPDAVYAEPGFRPDERPLDWAGSRAAPSAGSGYRGAFSPTPSSGYASAVSPSLLSPAPAAGEPAAKVSSTPSARRRAQGGRDLYTTLGAVHQGQAAAGAPGWAERGTEEPRVRTAGNVLRTLALASDEEEVVRIIIDRGQELRGTMNLPSPVAKVIEEIRSQASSAAAPSQALLGGAVGGGASSRSSRGGKTGSTRSSARVISGWTGLAARSSATSTAGVGDDRITKLVRKLKGLILLAENQKSDAQRQVRLAASDAPGVRSEGSSDLSSNEKSEQQDVDVEALAREVLEVVSRELELRQERRQEDPDVSIWW